MFLLIANASHFGDHSRGTRVILYLRLHTILCYFNEKRQSKSWCSCRFQSRHVQKFAPNHGDLSSGENPKEVERWIIRLR